MKEDTEDTGDWEECEQRIHAVLGDISERSFENAERYRLHLRQALKLPLLVTGREDFPWEEPYVFGGWSQVEYKQLKKTQPSFEDTFELLDLLEPNEDDDVTAQIRRTSDGRAFEIGLSWLKPKDKKSAAFRLLDDYASWHANY